MKIKVWASTREQLPTSGQYKVLDIVEGESAYVIGAMTHYGEVILIPPPIPPFTDGADLSAIVKLDPNSLATRPDDSVFEGPPSFYNKTQFFPILADTLGYLSDEPPLTGTHTILANENLTIENVSYLITPNTFSGWKADCMISKDAADALDNVKFAIVHRYSTLTPEDSEWDTYSRELVNLAVACMSLVRPTKRSRAMNVIGVIKPDETFDPQTFNTMHEAPEVPEIQKLFTIRKKDIDVLSSVLPDFIKLYQKDSQGSP